MDVNLPNGRVLRGVPDGTTQSQIIAKLRAAGEDVSWANEPTPASAAEKQAAETGAGEAFMVAAGRKTNAILDGLTQLYLRSRGETSALGGLKKNVAEGESIYRPLAQARPFVTGLGEALPAMAVPGSGAGYGGAMVAGALPELLSYGSDEERLKKGAVGAAGGGIGRAVGGLLSSVIKPSGVGVSVSKDTISAADRLGFKPLAGQATQNPALLNFENYLARTPGSSGTMAAINKGNTEAINRAALRSIGQTGDDVSPSILGAAQRGLGDEFTRLQGATSPKLGDAFMESLDAIKKANDALGPFRKPEVDGLLKKATELASGGGLSGKAYKEIHSELASEGTKAFKAGDSTLGHAYKTVRDALDNSAGESLSAADRAAWDTVRDQWGNFKTLTKGLVAEGGNVSPARVAAQLRTQGPGFRTGKTTGELADIGRIGEGIKGAPNPNSGNLGQMMLYGNPFTGVPLAAGNFTAAKLYTHPAIQKYMRDGILDIGKNGELIVRATGVPLGVAETKQILGVE